MTITKSSPAEFAPFASSTSGSASGQPPSATKSSAQSLTQADFLKLLTTQLSQQDPMKPMDDTAFVAQMAQPSARRQARRW